MQIAVIINRRARLARSEPGMEIIKRKFGSALHSIDVTASADEAARVLRRAVFANVDTAVVVGGDGTVNGVLDVRAGTEIALGIIPDGTANDLSSLHKLPAQLSAASDVILQRQLRAVDLISMNGRHFATGGGLGFPATVAAKANALKSRQAGRKVAPVRLGSELYLVSTVLALLRKAGPAVRLTIQSDHGAIEADCLALTVSNQPFLGRYFHVAPQAANDDGQFEVAVVKHPRSRIELAAILFHVLRGSHASLHSVSTWRAREFQVHACEPLPFYADGEHLDTRRQFVIRIAPRALHLIVPPHPAEGAPHDGD